MTAPSHKGADSRPTFVTRQYEFAAHIRDPQRSPLPADVEDRRMAIYRELFFNNVRGFLESGFPVLHSLYTDADWQAMARDFFSRHRCQSPLFLEIAEEFLDYLQNERITQPEDPPFLLELAHYEWVELALSVAEEEIDLSGINPDGDLLEEVPVVSPLAWPLSYSFEVHRISTEYRPVAPGAQPTHIVVYRDCDDEVHFMEVNVVTARLLHLLSEDDALTGRAALEQIAGELHHPQPEVVIAGGRQTLEELKRRDILLGTKT